MKQIEIFYNSSVLDLEKNVNEFLKKIQDFPVIDIKYSVYFACSYVLIIYEIEGD